MRELFAAPTSPTFFVGAGVSCRQGLPAVTDFIAHTTRQLVHRSGTDIPVDDVLTALTRNRVTFEYFLEILHEQAIDVLRGIVPLFRTGVPGAYHHMLAQVLASPRHATVFTTNFDLLVERAAGEALSVVVDDDECAVRPGGTLFKIHGSADRPESLVAVLSRVGQGLAARHAEYLGERLESGPMIVVGWAGRDLDIVPIFRRANPHLLVWFGYRDAFVGWSRSEDDDFEAMVASYGADLTGLLSRGRCVFIEGNPDALLGEALPGLVEDSDVAKVTELVDWRAGVTEWIREIPVPRAARAVLALLRRAGMYEQGETFANAWAIANRSPELVFQLAQCVYDQQRHDEALRLFAVYCRRTGLPDDFDALPDAVASRPEFAPLCGMLGMVFRDVADVERARRFLELDVRLSESPKAMVNLGTFRIRHEGKPREGYELAVRAEAQARETGDLQTKVGAIALMIQCLLHDDFVEKDAALAAKFHMYAAHLEGVSDTLGERIATLNDLLEIIGNRQEALHHLGVVLRALLRQARLDEARQAIERAQASWTSTDPAPGRAETLNIKGVVLKELAVRALGRGESRDTVRTLAIEAMKSFEECMSLARSVNEAWLYSAGLANRGMVRGLFLDELPAAEQDLQQALALKARLGDLAGAVSVLENLTSVLGAQGRESEATAAYRNAQALRQKISLSLTANRVNHSTE